MAYVYRHIRLDKNEPFYIGIGSNNDYNRANSKHGRNKLWKDIVKKSDYITEIIVDNLNWKDACNKEIEFILLYGRKDNNTGSLVNLTNGGEGTIGYIPSGETIEKRAKKMRGSLNHHYGKKFSVEYRKKLSDAKLGKVRNPLLMKKLHETIRKKITNGEIIFNSLGDAALYYKVHQTTITRWLNKNLKNLKSIN
jgi:hypothetical protein